jgi:hypothetical protein
MLTANSVPIAMCSALFMGLEFLAECDVEEGEYHNLGI